MSVVRHGVSRTSGAIRSLATVSAISTVGCRNKIGAASWAIWNPIAFSSSSVFPTCAHDITTTVCVNGSEMASRISRWYSARAVRHCPGSLDASRDN